MGKEDQKKPLSNDKTPVTTAPPSALPSKPPEYSEPPKDIFFFNRQWSEEGESMSPSSYQIWGRLKKICIARLIPRPIHPSLYLCGPNLWIGMEGHYASNRPDSFLIRKAWVLAQATQVGDNFHLQWAPKPMAPENEGINVPIPTGAQAVPLADPHWNQNGEKD
jgi:hypothetical protein